MSGSGGNLGLGFVSGTVVQEFCYDEDVDQKLRTEITSATGEELVGEEYDDVVDGALVWWRSDDGVVEDLADLLVDAMSNLDNGGLIWVCTPKPNRDFHVPPAEVNEAASTAGLSPTSTASVGSEWSGMRLTARPRQT